MNAHENPAGHPLRQWRIWLAPIAVVAVLMAVLGTMYLAYGADPEKNLHDFPIALVNSDEGDVLAGKPARIGDQIADTLVNAIPADKVNLRVVGLNEAGLLLNQGKVYGAIIIPSDFTKRLGILAAAGVVPGDIERPTITIETNPRIGPYATSTMQRIANTALTQVDAAVGGQLVGAVRDQLGGRHSSAATELTGATLLTLHSPITVSVVPHRPLSAGTGQGLSAFFYALVMVLAGFIGAMIIHTMVDASLGFTPTEYGPWYAHLPPTPISRLRTLLYKWTIMLSVAPIVSAIFLAVAWTLDMPTPNALTLFLFGILVIVAVGITALAILAALGTAGLLVNLVLFVVLGLPSTGGTVPVEATPKYIAWLANFEPMRQVYVGMRATAYFDAHLDAGLSQGIWMSLLGLAIGLVLGIATTGLYDWRGLSRTKNSPTPPASDPLAQDVTLEKAMA
ncbi:DUF3533 domain-containing protein [Nocardia tengchongensis]|uniref:YhgE/Pip domain-containing protein n=1 Tax=Nocardia tengchongensis TaxID=2055889 RepID=UPI0036AEAFF2